MENNLNFETYLFISPKKLVISVNNSTNEIIYKKELLFQQNSDQLAFNKLDYFLNEHIFKIEKILKNFVKKIFIILDLNNFFVVEISIKKNNFENTISLETLTHLLYEAKNYCKKTIDDRKIIHMIINNYQIDNKNYSFFPKNINANNFSLDVKFICISNNFIRNLEEILKKYQISVSRVLSANYINNFFVDDEKDIFLMAKKINDGYNLNEVTLVNKSIKNQGFFEKFFNFFN